MYVIPFMSLGGVLYEVRIGTGTRVELIGASRPFVTQEDDDDDMFKPVRLQSGYIRIVDTGVDDDDNTFDWRTLIPTSAVSTKVELYRGSYVMWRGFIKPETYSGDYLLMPQEREYPIVCQLSVLEGFDVSPSAGDIVNIAYLLHYIFSQAGTWGNFYFQGVNAVDSWLLKQVSWLNFVEYDEEGTARSKYNCLKLLEEICKFFGWTCRTCGADVYFSAADDNVAVNGYEYIDWQSLSGLAQGTPQQSTTASWMDEPILNLFANTNNIEEYVQGIRKVTVKADINKKDTLIEIPFSNIEKLFRGKSVSRTSQGDSWSFIVEYYPLEYEDGNIKIECYSDSTEDFTAGRFSATETYVGQLSDKHNYNFTYGLSIFGKNFPYNECVWLESKYPYSFFGGMITINGSITPYESAQPNGILQLALKVGDYYWSGSSWTTTQSRFEVRIEGGVIADTRPLDSQYDAYTGVGIPVSARSGFVKVYILGIWGDGVVEGFGGRITRFEIGFVRRSDLVPNSDRSSNVYNATGSSVFANDYSVDTVLASDDGNTIGLGLLINGNSGYVQMLPYTDGGGITNEVPEQHLAERIAHYGSSVRRKLTLELQESELTDITPQFMLSEPSGQSNLFPVSISHDWRENIVKLTLFEL